MDTQPLENPTRSNRPRHSKGRKKISGAVRARRIGLVLLVVVVLLVGTFYLYVQHLNHQISRVTVGGLAPAVANQPLNILLVGSNTRTGLKPSDAQYYGSGSQVAGARSDVTMIAHFDPNTDKVSLVSIPRDLFMPMVNSSVNNRVDSALNTSPAQLVKTIEQDLGIPIQHFVELNFDSFQSVVQALGGVKMDFPMPVRDAYSGLNITTTGCQLLNGFQALQVVRARHLEYYSNGVWTEDPLGDLSRIRRDHEFLKVLAQQVKSRGLTNPLTINSIVSGIVKYLEVDSGFSLSDMVSLAVKYRHANPATISTVTLPVALVNGPNNGGFFYNGVNYGDVVFPAEPQDTQLIDQELGLKVPNIPTSSIKVSVLNGSGAYQQASSVASSLRALGYNIQTIGNATITSTVYPQSVNPDETIIRYEPGYLAQAEVLKNSLSGAVIMGQFQHTSTGAPVELVTGTQLTVASPPSTSTTQTPATTATTTHSSKATTSTTSITAPITLPATLSNQSLQPWDPRGC